MRDLWKIKYFTLISTVLNIFNLDVYPFLVLELQNKAWASSFCTYKNSPDTPIFFENTEIVNFEFYNTKFYIMMVEFEIQNFNFELHNPKYNTNLYFGFSNLK